MFDNPMRISGLVSGMDIDQMVDKLMKAERMPLDKIKQQQKTLEWKRDNYRDMNKLLNELDILIFDGISRQSTFLQKTVMSSEESAVTAVASGLNSNISTQISVSQLARAAAGASEYSISSSDDFDPDASLENQAEWLNGTEFGTEFKLSALQADGTMKDQVFQIDASTDSLNDVLERVNRSDLGVTAFYDGYSGKVSIASNHTGSNGAVAEITVDEMGGKFFTDVLQFSSTDLANNGQNAKFTLNGLETERTSNTFMAGGMTYSLKNTTSSPVYISTATDVDAIYDSIEQFVNKYNETIETINDKLGEKRYRGYPPLTKDQREEMSDHEIELWEEKAQSGMLKRDSVLSGGLSEMRLGLYSGIHGEHIDEDFNQLSKLGIVTSSNYRENGKLIIQDPTKLRNAISEHPDKVYQLFNHDGDSFETKGIAGRLRDSIKGTMGQIEHKAGNSFQTEEQYAIGKKLKDNASQIVDFEQRLQQIQDRYYRQFTAMERAIQRANQQSVFLMNAFSTGQ